MSIETDARDCEVALLGCVLAGAPDLDGLFDTVDAGDFYHPFHGEVWNACVRVHRTGSAPNAMTVRLALDGVKGDSSQLVNWQTDALAPWEAAYYADKVSMFAGLRAIQRAGVQVSQIGTTMGDLDERREQARQAIDAATQGKVRNRARTLAQILPSVIDTAENGQAYMLPTGWPDLDRLIGGLAPGRLIVVGARPGVGKSVMGTNLALHMAATHGHAALIASMEMPEDEVGQRLLATHASVNLTSLQHGVDDPAAWDRIAAKATELEQLPITIDDTPGQTVSTIRRAARNIQRTRDDLALIVVDYLQQVRASDSRLSSRVEQLGEVSRNLKLLARETGACVVAMAQVNREGAKSGAPRMTDLRESGSIEADADQVIIMHQPSEESPELEVVVDKNRHGPKGVCTLKMQGHYARLVSVQWTPTSVLEVAR